MKAQGTEWARLTLRMPASLHRRVRAEADAQHISLNSLIVRAISRPTIARRHQDRRGTQQKASQ